jgi:hypothetical protein
MMAALAAFFLPKKKPETTWVPFYAEGDIVTGPEIDVRHIVIGQWADYWPPKQTEEDRG